MGHLFKTCFTRAFPSGGVVVVHEGRDCVWVKGRHGGGRYLPVAGRSGRLLQQSAVWYISYADASGKLQKEKGTADREETSALLDRREREVRETVSSLKLMGVSRDVLRVQNKMAVRPRSLAPVGGLLGLDLSLIPFLSAIYFLCREGEVVYVGQSFNFVRRVVKHLETKSFDSVFYVPTPLDQLAAAEDTYIRLYEPEYNRDKNGRLVVGRPKRKPSAEQVYKKRPQVPSASPPVSIDVTI